MNGDRQSFARVSAGRQGKAIRITKGIQMKKLIVALAAGLISTAAVAQSAKVPTGIDVKGATYYRLEPVMGGHRVVQISEACDARARNRRDPVCLNAIDPTGAGVSGAAPNGQTTGQAIGN